MITMLGCLRLAASWASRWNLSTKVGSRNSRGSKNLRATGRLRVVSIAL
jgi:hypothetical protein